MCLKLGDPTLILDDSTKISKLDTENMFEMVYNWPDLIERTLRFSFEVPKNVTVGKYKISYENSISNIVICGMGGSAISGDFLKVYLEKTLQYIWIVGLFSGCNDQVCSNKFTSSGLRFFIILILAKVEHLHFSMFFRVSLVFSSWNG